LSFSGPAIFSRCDIFHRNLWLKLYTGIENCTSWSRRSWGLFQCRISGGRR